MLSLFINFSPRIPVVRSGVAGERHHGTLSQIIVIRERKHTSLFRGDIVPLPGLCVPLQGSFVHSCLSFPLQPIFQSEALFLCFFFSFFLLFCFVVTTQRRMCFPGYQLESINKVNALLRSASSLSIPVLCACTATLR